MLYTEGCLFCLGFCLGFCRYGFCHSEGNSILCGFKLFLNDKTR